MPILSFLNDYFHRLPGNQKDLRTIRDFINFRAREKEQTPKFVVDADGEIDYELYHEFEVATSIGQFFFYENDGNIFIIHEGDIIFQYNV